jgi:hypothetical protein
VRGRGLAAGLLENAGLGITGAVAEDCKAEGIWSGCGGEGR